jgi:predicted ATP-dependent serine protease
MRVMTTAKKLHRKQWKKIEQNACPSVVIGDGAVIGIYGAAGQGKSTLACRIADGIPGAALYIPAEEGQSPSTSSRLLRGNVKGDDFFIASPGEVAAIAKDAQDVGATSLVIDSLQVATWSAGDLRRVIDLVSSLSVVIATMQVNKRGLPAGENAIIHEVDITIRVESMRWELEKSRLGPERGLWRRTAGGADLSKSSVSPHGA